ncbi:MAG: MFS transporter [Saprospiraceae bacterium]
MNKILGNVLIWSLSVSMGGFLFGFDTAVISGGEQQIQKIWSLSPFMLGQMVAMGLYGTIIGAILGGIPANRFGRKITLLVIGLFFFGMFCRFCNVYECEYANVF